MVNKINHMIFNESFRFYNLYFFVFGVLNINFNTFMISCVITIFELFLKLLFKTGDIDYSVLNNAIYQKFKYKLIWNFENFMDFKYDMNIDVNS